MDGFVSTMYDIAKHMDDDGLETRFTPKAIFPTSETVMPYHREMLEKVFKCKVRDQYASSGGASFVIEFPDGYMHECLDTGVFEHISNANLSNVIKHLPNSIANIQFVQDGKNHIYINVVVDKRRYK